MTVQNIKPVSLVVQKMKKSMRIVKTALCRVKPSQHRGGTRVVLPKAANVSLRSFLSMKPSLFWSMIVKACGGFIGHWFSSMYSKHSAQNKLTQAQCERKHLPKHWLLWTPGSGPVQTWRTHWSWPPLLSSSLSWVPAGFNNDALIRSDTNDTIITWVSASASLIIGFTGTHALMITSQWSTNLQCVCVLVGWGGGGGGGVLIAH